MFSHIMFMKSNINQNSLHVFCYLLCALIMFNSESWWYLSWSQQCATSTAQYRFAYREEWKIMRPRKQNQTHDLPIYLYLHIQAAHQDRKKGKPCGPASRTKRMICPSIYIYIYKRLTKTETRENHAAPQAEPNARFIHRHFSYCLQHTHKEWRKRTIRLQKKPLEEEKKTMRPREHSIYIYMSKHLTETERRKTMRPRKQNQMHDFPSGDKPSTRFPPGGLERKTSCCRRGPPGFRSWRRLSNSKFLP